MPRPPVQLRRPSSPQLVHNRCLGLDVPAALISDTTDSPAADQPTDSHSSVGAAAVAHPLAIRHPRQVPERGAAPPQRTRNEAGREQYAYWAAAGAPGRGDRG
jgi:hypothetical protein